MPPRQCRTILRNLDSRFFKALCDPNRLAILARMTECCRPVTVGDIASCCTVDFSVVSRHLRTLREAGIIEAERHGREIHHRVRFQAVAASLRRLADALESCCPATPNTQSGEKS